MGVCQCPSIAKDPTTIKFGPAGAGLDHLRSHGRVLIFEPVNVMASDVGWLLTNGGGRIYGVTLSGGAFTSNLNHTLFKYKNPDARIHGGIYEALIHITRSGVSYGYKVDTYGDMSRATDALMSLQFYMGNQPTAAIHTETWTKRKDGWASHGFSS